jgi:predicted DCC family thiol-disulfide oxidoreductase YuxK
MVSILGAIFQSIFQFLMIPLVFTKIGSGFVKWWGINFFVLSLFFINLSYLPHIELLLWFGIFFPISTNSKKVKILYDDHCNLCKKSMLTLKSINFNNRFDFLALSKNKELYTQNGLNEKQVKSYMVGWYKGELYIGYSLYIKICSVNPLLWVLLPIFYLGKISFIGPIIYNYIAERRYRIFGVCKFSFEDEIQKNRTFFKSKLNKKLFYVFYLGYSFILFVFIVFQFPVLQQYSTSIFPNKVVYNTNFILTHAGLDVPHVFNKTDLSMGNNWMVIYKLDENGNRVDLLPYCGKDGQRLNNLNFDFLFFSNHNSDALYFRTTSRYRRAIIYTDDKKHFHLDSNELGFNNIQRRLKYYYRNNHLEGLVSFEINILQNQSSNVVHWQSNPSRHDASLFLSAVYFFICCLLL